MVIVTTEKSPLLGSPGDLQMEGQGGGRVLVLGTTGTFALVLAVSLIGAVLLASVVVVMVLRRRRKKPVPREPESEPVYETALSLGLSAESPLNLTIIDVLAHGLLSDSDSPSG
jgi:hypothetical protein